MVLLFMSDCGHLVSGHVDPPHQNSIIFAADLKKKKKSVFTKRQWLMLLSVRGK